MRNGAKKNYPRLYKIWQGMRQRCGNPNDKDFRKYGARGISVCSEWDNDSMKFIQWALQNGYDDKLSIDRINVNGNYEPNNCRWADALMQARNRRVSPQSKTGMDGVHYERDRNKYRAVIYVHDKRIDLGRYTNIEDAMSARKRGEELYWGGGVT